jgi:hypothetical protein
MLGICGDIISQGAPPPVLTAPVAHFATCIAGDVDIGGKFATSVNNTGGNLPQVSMTQASKNGNNIRLLMP